MSFTPSGGLAISNHSLSVRVEEREFVLARHEAGLEVAQLDPVQGKHVLLLLLLKATGLQSVPRAVRTVNLFDFTSGKSSKFSYIYRASI